MTNAGYEIITDMFGYAIGHKADHPLPHYRYVVWVHNSRGFDCGHYFETYKEALKDMTRRM